MLIIKKNKKTFVSRVPKRKGFVIKFCPRSPIFAHFSNSNFLVMAPKKEIRKPTGLELVHWFMFSTVLAFLTSLWLRYVCADFGHIFF